VDLATGKTLGYEMLARWKHPERGLLLPNSFIPIAEDTGLIGGLTYSLLRRACRDAKDWDDTLFLSINLAPSQLVDPWLAQEILGILAECNFPARRLEIEITETALMQKLEQAKVVIESLRNLGVRVALDDFGTGYSGLHHLRDLQLDTLKIDRSFITDMLARPEQARIVEAILGLSKALGLQATAEGIETPEILERLTALGCQMGQGYYFGAPQPAAEIRAAQAAERRRLA
jgi:EAL domain-containing protein (putative c-di-GMP-specific phosphodiesterase class I)